MTTFLILTLAGSASLATAHPFTLWSRADVPKFPAGSSWDIKLAGGADLSGVQGVGGDDFQIIDIDLFDNSKETIAELKRTKKVICYFSAGSKEGWRPDASKFKDADTRNAVGGGPNGDWPDEVWVDVTSENVKSIMKSRIELAAKNGCDAVDPDNVDGFANDTGFDHDKNNYVEYVKYMAQVANANGLAIGLKNAVDMISDVVSNVDFALNEQCHEFGECASYKPFTDQNKAVFNIEYGGNACDSPAGVKLSTLIKNEDQGLSELGGACPGQGVDAPPAVEQPKPSASSSAPIATPSSQISQPTAAPTTPTEEDQPEEDEAEEENQDDDEEDKKGHPFRWYPKSRPSWRSRPWNRIEK